MILVYIWGFVAAYFSLLWFATSLEMALAGTVIFVFWAAKITVQALLLLAKERRDHHPQPLAANLDHPPG
jgi:hypothetical protein